MFPIGNDKDRFGKYEFDSSLNAWKISDDIEYDNISATNNPTFQGYHLAAHTSYALTSYKPSNVLINIGEHYNASTGIFTAPLKGSYICTFDALILTPEVLSYTYCEWIKNTERYCIAHTMYNIARSYEPLCLNCIMYCDAGDEIQLRLNTVNNAKLYLAYYNRMGITFVG